jgi:hypothetical protein
MGKMEGRRYGDAWKRAHTCSMAPLGMCMSAYAVLGCFSRKGTTD